MRKTKRPRLLAASFQVNVDYCGWLVCTPIASPETTMLTRRFCWRPAAVPLSATGLALPYPAAVTLAAGTPLETQDVLVD